MKQKLNNYGLWIAMFALAGLFLNDFVPGFDSARYDIYVEAFLAVLIAAGVVSNPSVGKWFNDTKGDVK